jgi:hypothetical protein
MGCIHAKALGFEGLGVVPKRLISVVATVEPLLRTQQRDSTTPPTDV